MTETQVKKKNYKGKPIAGMQHKLPASIRLELRYREAIERTDRTIQQWFDDKLLEDFGEHADKEPIQVKPKISADDF